MRLPRFVRLLPAALIAIIFAAGALPAAAVSLPGQIPTWPANETQPAVATTLADELQAVIDKAQVEKPIVGLAAAVTFADGSRWESGSGLAELGDPDRPFEASTPSVAGSITKTFIAALVLQLVEEGG